MKKLIASAIILCTFSASHATEDWPKQSIKIVVGYAAGGTTDLLARALGEAVSNEIGHPVIIENKPGAAGNIAAASVQNSNDGHTFFMATVSSHGINPAMFSSEKELGYAPRGFKPVSMVASIPLVLITNKTSEFTSVDKIIAKAKAQPESIFYASSGIGSPVHIAGAMFSNTAKVRMTHVPYRGGGLANQSVLANETQLSFATMPGAMPQIKADKLQALAVTTKTRSPLLPNTPALKEIPGFENYEINTWNALMAPGTTPPAVVSKLNAALVAALKKEKLNAKFLQEGAIPESSTPETLSKFIDEQLRYWPGVVQELSSQLSK